MKGWSKIPTLLTRMMLALLLILLATALLLGANQAPENRRAFGLALVALLVLWKGLPWLARRGAAMGAWKVWLLLTILCLVVKGAWVVLVRLPLEYDYATFWNYANELATQPVVDNSRYLALFPHIFGYASFLSWFVKLFGPQPLLAQGINVLLTLCSGSLLFLLGRRFWGLAGGTAAYLLWIVCPSQTMYNSMVLSEPLYTTLLLLFLFLLSGPLPRRMGQTLLLGGGAGLVLRWFHGVRPIGAVLLIALALWRFCLAPDGLLERESRRHWLALLGALLAVYLATGPLWQARIAARIGEEPSTTPGYSVLVGFNETASGVWNQADSDLLYSYSNQPGTTAQQAQEQAMDAAVERITSGELNFVALFREKLRGFLGADSACVSYSARVVRHTVWFARGCNAFFYLVLLLSTGGAVALWREKDRSIVLLLPLYLLGLTAAQMLVEVAGRYHYSMIPIFLLLAQRALISPERESF